MGCQARLEPPNPDCTAFQAIHWAPQALDVIVGNPLFVKEKGPRLDSAEGAHPTGARVDGDDLARQS